MMQIVRKVALHCPRVHDDAIRIVEGRGRACNFYSGCGESRIFRVYYK